MKKLNLPQSVISNVNAIFIIDCLDSDELQTALHNKEHIDDLLPNEIRENHIINRKKCDNLSDFINEIERIYSLCVNGVRPLIHIHGHGNKIKGLQFFSNEFISWHDLMEWFKKITYTAQGETTIVMSSCYSFNVVHAFLDKYEKELQIISPVPFAFFYGYHDEIPAGIIDDEAKYISESVIYDGGKSIMDNLDKLKISLYSEYDYIDGMLAFVLHMMQSQEPNTSIIADLSAKKFKEQIIKKNKDNGIPFKFSRNFLKDIKNNPMLILEGIVNNAMYDTNRKKMYLEVLKNIDWRHS